MILALGLLVVAFTWGLPRYQKYQELSSQISELEGRKQAMEAEKQRLQQEAQWFQSDAAVEKIAREELGLVKPGEMPLVDITSPR
jgi:cell division protein FtsL